jgi:hypothetical protein
MLISYKGFGPRAKQTTSSIAVINQHALPGSHQFLARLGVEFPAFRAVYACFDVAFHFWDGNDVTDFSNPSDIWMSRFAGTQDDGHGSNHAD